MFGFMCNYDYFICYTEIMILNFIRRIIRVFKSERLLYVAVDSGSKDKPVIVLLHGIAATSKSWDYLVDDLDVKKYRIIALDMLGFGESPKPLMCKYSVEDHVVYVHRTLKNLGVKAPFTLAGHSMGSIIATHYCTKFHKDVERLFLLSLPLYAKNADLKQTYLSEKQTDLFLKAFDYLSQKKNITINYSQKIRKILRLHDGMDVTGDNWNGFRMSLINTIINQNTYNEILDLKMPIQIIYGALDSFVVQKSVDRLAKQPNVSILKLPAVHHLIDKKFASAVAKSFDSNLV